MKKLSDDRCRAVTLCEFLLFAKSSKLYHAALHQPISALTQRLTEMIHA